MLGLKNNFIMPPIKLGYCNNQGFVNEKHIHFYQQITNGLGAVAPEPFYMHSSLREIPTQLGIDTDDKIEGLSTLSNVIHNNDAKAIAHLNHPGRMANPMIPNNIYISSTDQACETGGKKPKKMNRDDMNEVIDLFVQSAKRAEQSGFDIIEIQAGHGYLLAQFISKAVNNRTDEYGGNFENRIKFPIQVIQAVIRAINIPVIVRISASEMIPNGIQLDEMLQFAKILEKINVKAIHVSTGTVCQTPPWYFQHMFVPKGKSWKMASIINKEVNIPVVFVGQINSHEDIDTIKNIYKGEYFAVGRAMIADRDFINKYLDKNLGNYRPCLACSEGCLGGVKSGKGLGCVVNPTINNPVKFPNQINNKLKNVAIIGGGLAGMESALRLHKSGCKVQIFEKEKLGGQFNLAWLPPKKQSLKKLIDYYITEIEKNQIPVVYQEVHSADKIIRNFDNVLIATGATLFNPKIKGLHNFYWAELLENANKLKNERILIIGGGLIGVEIASMLVDNDNEVIIVEMLEELAQGMEMIERKMSLKKLKDKSVKILTNHRVIEVNEDEKSVILKGEIQFLENIDKIVLATGMKSVNDLEEKLVNKIDYLVVGDAVKPAKAQEAIISAYNAAVEICS